MVESLSTAGACIGLLTSVYATVCDEVSLCSETLATGFTHKWPSSSACIHVNLELGIVRKMLTAYVTLLSFG